MTKKWFKRNKCANGAFYYDFKMKKVLFLSVVLKQRKTVVFYKIVRLIFEKSNTYKRSSVSFRKDGNFRTIRNYFHKRGWWH